MGYDTTLGEPLHAIDGNISTCFYAKASPSDLTIDLGKKHYIYEIVLTLKSNFTYRLNKAGIYVDKNKTATCVNFGQNVEDINLAVKCKAHARYITITNPNSILTRTVGQDELMYALVLCEVRIYVCVTGTYGVSCNKFCHCLNMECNRGTGVCSACKPGWQGPKCSQSICPIGRFGDDCATSCNCGDYCNQVTGVCEAACDGGWMTSAGRRCQTQNVAYLKLTVSRWLHTPSWYPGNAVDSDPESCYQSANSKSQLVIDFGTFLQIAKVKLTFKNGVDPGLGSAVVYVNGDETDECYKFSSSYSRTNFQFSCQGFVRNITFFSASSRITICDVQVIKCSSATYGGTCGSFCHCLQGGCLDGSGVCESGCITGWKGSQCSTRCSENGEFGINCRGKCSKRHCLDDSSTCDPVTGACPSGCEVGWLSTACNIRACPKGKFGLGCRQSCNCGNNCNVMTGKCDRPCEPGWSKVDGKCQLASGGKCDVGQFGSTCGQFCHCLNGSCDRNTGKCEEGECTPGWSEESCSKADCKPGLYGYNCSFYCNCGLLCDQETGECPQTCDPGWIMHDNVCQKRNLANEKKASNTLGSVRGWDVKTVSRHNKHSTKPVKGPKICYQSEELRGDITIDLRTKYYIQEVTVYMYVGHNSGLANAVAYRDKNLSKICHNFPAHIKDNPYTFQCQGRSQHITILTSGKSLEQKDRLTICKIEITDCSAGTFGTNCSTYCRCGLPQRCPLISGACVGDCQPGWKLRNCSIVCANGEYGINCVTRCTRRHCINRNDSCHPIMGTCDSGCQDGFTGVDCRDRCARGFYGFNCSSKCIERNCRGRSECDYMYGLCRKGCKIGWSPHTRDCSERCPPVTYGQDCAYSCLSRNCLIPSATCNYTGLCPKGCKGGWVGRTCTKKLDKLSSKNTTQCDEGTYLDDSRQHCLNCSLRMCASESSSCGMYDGGCDGGCQLGYQEPSCMDTCHRSYGPKCKFLCEERHCRSVYAVCNSTNGYCEYLCAANWTGRLCLTEFKIPQSRITNHTWEYHPAQFGAFVGVSIGTVVACIITSHRKCGRADLSYPLDPY